MSISFPSADFAPTLSGYTGQGPFRFWCQKVLPIVYDDSLSYYELLNKVVVYLNNVIADVATVEENVGSLNESYNSLQAYVNEHMQELVNVVNQYTEFTENYFNNLDVQEEINNKLDEMASDGSLSTLIGPIVVATAPDVIAQWLSDHITPTTPIVDNTLTISGAAADSKVTGDTFKTSYIMHPRYQATANNSIEDITEYGSFWLSASIFGDLPLNQTGLLINDSCGTGYIHQLFLPSQSRCILRRVKATGSSGTTSSWRELVLSDDRIVSLIGDNIGSYPEIESINNTLDTETYRMHPHYPATENNSIEDITEYGSFWLSASIFVDLPLNQTGLLINDSCGTGYIHQTFIPSQSSSILRRVKATGSGTTSDWNELVVSQERISEIEADVATLKSTAYIIHPHYSGTTNNSIEDITEYGSFWLSSAIFNDLPDNNTGLLINEGSGTGYLYQLYIPSNGRVVYRRIKATGSGTTGTWTELVLSDDRINTLIANYVNSDSDIFQYKGFASNINALYDNGTYFVSSSTIEDITQLPADESGLIEVIRLNNGYVMQVYWSIYGYAKYYRYLAFPDGSGTTTTWKKISILEDLRVIVFGDSITAGYRNGGKGYIGLCNVREYKNASHAGDSLANISGRGHVYSQLTASSAVINYNADVVIISGGFNDYNNSAPLGTMPNIPITSDAQFNAMDDTTVSGGLQKALYLGIKQYPDSQKAFLITHRTSTYPYTPCSAGYTQTELFEFIKAICRLYGYVIIDVFNDSSLNTAFDCYVSPVDYGEPTEAALTARYAVNSDRIHPLQYGYVNYYVPLVNQYLQTCTRKMANIPF